MFSMAVESATMRLAIRRAAARAQRRPRAPSRRAATGASARLVGLLMSAALVGPSVSAEANDQAEASADSGQALAALFQAQVDRRLSVPESEKRAYARRLSHALAASPLTAGRLPLPPQFVLLIDRDARVQAALLYWLDGEGVPQFIGAAPVSTGRPSGYEHFDTPTGVFEHSLANPDFRAEGTRNELGVRGYGSAGRRVFDFGWVEAWKGWGSRGFGTMRLQLHATDPLLLEPRLGQRESKGCVRIPATLNDFLDRHGILDADYERALNAGEPLWVLRADRTPTRWSGRYVVIVDSARPERPTWSPAPRAR
jgi:hypothetical protein